MVPLVIELNWLNLLNEFTLVQLECCSAFRTLWLIRFNSFRLGWNGFILFDNDCLIGQIGVIDFNHCNWFRSLSWDEDCVVIYLVVDTADFDVTQNETTELNIHRFSCWLIVIGLLTAAGNRLVTDEFVCYPILLSQVRLG